MNNIQTYWEHVGKNDPHWGVLTHDKFRSRNINNNLDEFFESGRVDFNIINKYFRKYNDMYSPNILEIGPGVGRMSVFAAKAADHITCVDISRSYLSELENTFKKNNITNYTAVQLDDFIIDTNLNGIDLLYTVITLQHSYPDIIKSVLKRSFKSMNGGGVGYIHIPYHMKNVCADRDDVMQMHHLEQDEFRDICDEFNIQIHEIIDPADKCGPYIKDCIYITQKR